MDKNISSVFRFRSGVRRLASVVAVLLLLAFIPRAGFATSFSGMTISITTNYPGVSYNVALAEIQRARWGIVGVCAPTNIPGTGWGVGLSGWWGFCYTPQMNFYVPKTDPVNWTGVNFYYTYRYVPYSNTLSVSVSGPATPVVWTLTGPDELTNSTAYRTAWSGSVDLVAVPTGTYSVAALPGVRGYVTPTATSTNITGSSPLVNVLNLNYIPYSNSLAVTVSGITSGSNCVWTLTGPAEFANAVSYGTTFTNSFTVAAIPTGIYTVTFPAIVGYTAPAAVFTNIIGTSPLVNSMTGSYVSVIWPSATNPPAPPPTNFPTLTNAITLMVDSTGLFKTPSREKIIAANGLLTNGAVGPAGPTGATGPQGIPGSNGVDGVTGPQGPAGSNGVAGATGAQGPAGTNGATGVQGPQGVPGSNGIAGATGPAGSNGVAGAMGPQGPAGSNGVVGAQGPQGIQGPEGSNGIAGATGPQGPSGTNGAVGPQGIPGPAGTNGVDGAQGPQGIQGPAGTNGATGPQGPVGTNGIDGAQGLSGTNGADGAVGPAGTNGADGAVGPQGPAGTNGVNGAVGPQGPQGPAGTNGIDGATGPQGPAGSNGVDGAQGPQGIQGSAGTNGVDGAQGPAGTNGAVGPQGPAGTNGVDGAIGPQGLAGTNGVDGAQGPAGTNGTNGAIGPQGPQGPAGTNGVDGTQGPAGTNGADGAQGPQGPSGTNGVDGAVGPQGSAGTNGAVGPQGPAGPAGSNGIDGVQGPAGTNGIDGATGLQGPSGSNGVDGAQGPAGTNGVDGVQGPAGTNGVDGAVGPQGPVGSNGVDGAVGPQGPAGTNGVDGAQGPAGTNGVDGAVGPQGPTGTNGVDGAMGPAGPVTNQVITYLGIAYTITNDPASTGDILKFDPTTSNAWFAVESQVVYGTTNGSTYRGDWGASVSGQVAILNTNTATKTQGDTADAALPKSSTNALTVTTLKITGLSGNGVVPVGAVMQYISSNAPAGWLLCNGAAVGTNVYPALFAIIGTQYGGATTNMNLPDLRGRVVVGMGDGTGLTARNLNATGGVETVTLSIAQIPSHRHGKKDDIQTTAQSLGSAGWFSMGTSVSYTDYTGSDQPHNNMPPYIVVNYIIKY